MYLTDALVAVKNRRLERIGEIHSKVATLKMTNYEVLSNDYMLQRSVFGDKYSITVNFSDKPLECNGKLIAPESLVFEEIKII